jgi:hypothetical protein
VFRRSGNRFGEENTLGPLDGGREPDPLSTRDLSHQAIAGVVVERGNRAGRAEPEEDALTGVGVEKFWE